MSDVLVFIEYRNDRVIRVCKQILGFLSTASDTKKFKIVAFIYGEKIGQNIYDELSELGASEVFSAIDENLDHYNPEIIMPFFINVIKQLNSQYILFSNTAIGKDLAPRLAQEFSTEMISDVTDISFKRKQLLFTRPIYGGKIFETIQPKNKVFVTIRANFFEENDMIQKNNINRENDMNLNYVTAKRVKELTYILTDAINKRDETKVLTESEIIVCGGGGMKSAKNFIMLEELADLLGASVGASRAAVDAGYISRSALIGQTGKRVKPKLYLSFGVSGAMQHTAGMSTSGYIVAVNKDPEALIFDFADFGIVGDLFKILPLLICELRKYKEQNDRCIAASSDG